MTIDTVQPTLNVQAVHPRQDAKEQPGRESRRNGKPSQPEEERQDQAQTFLNVMGQVTGKTINITA
jgi:hypothetical protein